MLSYLASEDLEYVRFAVSLIHYLAVPTDCEFWSLRVPGCRS